MLEIDISRNYFPKDLGDLKRDFWGFGCPKDAPSWLRLMDRVRGNLAYFNGQTKLFDFSVGFI